MRRPIQRQLLWPMLAVVLLGSGATALFSAWLGMRTARQAEHERLKQLAGTLTDAGFPLTSAVLRRMSELSGAEFITLGEQGAVENASLKLSETDGEQLTRLPVDSSFDAASERAFQLSAGDFRALRIPVRTASSPRGLSLVILTSQERWNDLAWQAALPPLLAGLLAASGTALLAVLLSQRFVERIRQLADRAAILAEGRFAPEPLPAIDDELRDLAAALNTTAQQLDQYEQQIRSGERLQTLGRLGAGMAHQLRNAITGARMALDLHAAELPHPNDRESLDVAIRQLTLMDAYLQRFLRLGRGEAPECQDVDLGLLLGQALELVTPICRHHGIAVTWTPPERPVAIRGDPESLRQMALNLLINSIEAVQPLPIADRKCGVELDVADRTIRLQVWDHGPGPAAEIADAVFERFVTNKPDGTGLGLAVAQEIAQAHRGTIGWSRRDGRTWFVVELASPAQPDAGGAA